MMTKSIYLRKKLLSVVISAASLSLLPNIANAQIGGASVHGLVIEQQKPIAGMDVVAKNIDTGYTYKATTQTNGSYTFKNLAPGSYQIFLQNNMGQSASQLVLKVGQDASLDFEVGKSSGDNAIEELVVTGTKLKYSSGGEIGTNISLEQINRLPQSTRNFLSFADLAPGVQFQQGQDGSTRIKGGAQSANAVNVFIDGVGQKNYVLKGGITGQDSSRGNPFPQSAIGEYKVITQNYSAEYDQISSAAIVAVTASGTNEFHGGTFYDFSSDGTRKMTPSELETNKKIPGDQKQYGVHFGGPIIKDKMHFFFAYEGKDNSDPKDVIPEGGYTVANLPSELRGQVGGIASTFQEDLYFGKLDFVINDEQQLELSVKIRKENELTNLGGTSTLSSATDKKNNETRLDLSHNWHTESWVNDFHITSEDAEFNPRSHSQGIGKIYTNNNRNLVLKTGAGEDYQDKSQSGWGIQEDFTYFAIEHHAIKTGFKFKSIDLLAKEQQPFNPQFEYNLDYSATQPFDVRWGAPLASVGDGSAKAKNKQFGIYLQDDWAATSRLTVNAGLRWDYETSDSYLDYKTPNDVVSALNNWSNLQKSDVAINDYISTGNNRDAFKNAWQPRVGFTYALSDETDATMFGGLGRAYDRNLFDNLQVETTKATFPSYSRQFFAPANPQACSTLGGDCLAWDPKYLSLDGLNQLVAGEKGAGREIDVVNNHLRTPYSDQISFGVRGTLDNQWKAEVSLSHIHSKDGFAWVLGNRRTDGGFFEPGKHWGTPWGDNLPGYGSLLLGVNGIETKTNSLFVKIEMPKEDSNWGANIAYTLSRSTSNRKAGEVYSFDYPTVDGYGFHQTTDLPNHRLVATAIVDLPLGIDFSAKLNLQSKQTYYGTNCMAGWDACKIDEFKPDTIGFLGYRQLDIAFSKAISTGNWVQGSNLTVRLDVLNLTNAVNHDGFEDWIGGYDDGQHKADPNPNFQRPTKSLAGPTRTMKFGISWDW